MSDTLSKYSYRLTDANGSESVHVIQSAATKNPGTATYLVPGFYTGPLHYTHLSEWLAESNHNVLTIDIHGFPTIITEPFKKYDETTVTKAWASAAHFAITEHQKEMATEPINLIGYSLGGAGATLAALNIPSVKKLILFAPIGSRTLFEAFLLKLNRHRYTRPFIHLLYGPVLGIQTVFNTLQEKIAYLFSSSAKQETNFQKQDVQRKITEGTNKISYAVGFAKLTFELQKLKERGVEITIIAAKKDRFVSLQSLQTIAADTGVNFQTIDGDHNYLKTHPEKVVPFIQKALAAN